MKNKIEYLKEIIDKNNGILYIKDLDKYGIHRQYVKVLVDSGYIKRVEKGLYVKCGKELNEFFILGYKYKNAIFSHNTSLYFYGLTDRTPINYDLTFPSNVRVRNDMINVHYIKNDFLNLGLSSFKFKDGTSIKIYDMERTICDIVRDRNKIDLQIFNDAMKSYINNNNKNLIKLYDYANKFNIYKILYNYMEVL